jgi:hypothetical protein
LAFGGGDLGRLGRFDRRAVQWVRERVAYHAMGETYTERRLELEGITWGTADLVCIAGQEGLIIDAKFHGSGEVPLHMLAEQGCCYALGLLEEWPGAAVVTVIFLVPHAEREYRFTVPRRDKEAHTQRLRDAITWAEGADISDLADYSIGEHCHYCPARLCCPALQKEVGLLS